MANDRQIEQALKAERKRQAAAAAGAAVGHTLVTRGQRKKEQEAADQEAAAQFAFEEAQRERLEATEASQAETAARISLMESEQHRHNMTMWLQSPMGEKYSALLPRIHQTQALVKERDTQWRSAWAKALHDFEMSEQKENLPQDIPRKAEKLAFYSHNLGRINVLLVFGLLFMCLVNIVLRMGSVGPPSLASYLSAVSLFTLGLTLLLLAATSPLGWFYKRASKSDTEILTKRVEAHKQVCREKFGFDPRNENPCVESPWLSTPAGKDSLDLKSALESMENLDYHAWNEENFVKAETWFAIAELLTPVSKDLPAPVAQTLAEFHKDSA